MLEKLRRRIPEHWKTKLAPLAEWLILAEPQLRLTDDMDGDAIRREVAVYVKRCVRWQAKERQKLQAQRRGGAAATTGWPRPVGVGLAGIVGLSILAALGVWGYYGLHLEHGIDLSKWLEPNTVTGTLLSVLVGSPVAYIIWRYRDQNTLWQIENQRKDINLKDFQKLAEWASGQHLQEDKVVEQTKRTEKATASGPEITTETVTTREGSAPPDHARSVNKRTGGESLQVAAVYQLQAFLDGEFGKHFQRPAFQLLKSLWEGLVLEHVRKLDESILEKSENDALEQWRFDFSTIINTPFGLAVRESLVFGVQQQYSLHPEDISIGVLAGVNTRSPTSSPWKLAGLKLRSIDLRGVNLDLIKEHLKQRLFHDHKDEKNPLPHKNWRSINLQGADLQGANLCAAYLFGAHMQGVDLKFASMNKINLSFANLQGARLSYVNLEMASLHAAKLDSANLHQAKLKKVDLSHATLRWSDFGHATFEGIQYADFRFSDVRNSICIGMRFKWVNFEDANLSKANLMFSSFYECNLQRSNLTGSDLRGVSIDSKTNTKGAVYDGTTKFGTLKNGGVSSNDSDWIDAEAEEQRWRDLGARRVDEEPTV